MQSDEALDGELTDRSSPRPQTLEQCHQVIEVQAAYIEELRQRLVSQEEQLA